MKYDLSPREAEMIDSYRELSVDFQEDLCNWIISFYGAESIITEIKKKSRNPGTDDGKKRPDEKEKLKNI